MLVPIPVLRRIPLSMMDRRESREPWLPDTELWDVSVGPLHLCQRHLWSICSTGLSKLLWQVQSGGVWPRPRSSTSSPPRPSPHLVSKTWWSAEAWAPIDLEGWLERRACTRFRYDKISGRNSELHRRRFCWVRQKIWWARLEILLS